MLFGWVPRHNSHSHSPLSRGSIHKVVLIINDIYYIVWLGEALLDENDFDDEDDEEDSDNDEESDEDEDEGTGNDPEYNPRQDKLLNKQVNPAECKQQ